MYFVQCFTIANAKVTDDTIASLIKITYITYKCISKSIQRAPSVYNRAGVLTVELHSKDDKMKIIANKSKLRQSIDYQNVYLENTNSAVHMRIEEQINMLVNNVQNAPSFQYPRASKYHTASHARNNRYHNTQ